MSVITYSRLPQIDKALSLVLTDNGYLNINNSPFLNQFVTVVKEAVKGPYNELYSIASNIDIGRATGPYLDRWGTFLSQSRTMITYAYDLSLSNVEIYIYGDNSAPKAAEITNDAGDIVIPSGTRVSDPAGLYLFRTIDNTVISGDRNSVFVRVMSENNGNVYMPGGSLSNVSMSLNDVSNIMPMAAATYKLKSRNSKEIKGGTTVADDKTYSYMLQETAASLGLTNDRRVNLLYDVADIYDIKVIKFRGGISVFIDATDITKLETVIQTARNYARTNMNFGMPVYCFPPILKQFKPTISLVVKNKDNLGGDFSTFKTSLAEMLNKSKMGEPVQIQSMINELIPLTPGLLTGSMKEGYLSGRKLLGNTIELLFNERITTSAQDITIATVYA